MSESNIKEPYKDNKADADGGIGPPVLNEERYLAGVAGFDMSEEEQREFLRELWNILVMITDLKLGIDPVQMLFAEYVDLSTRSNENMVQSDVNPNRHSFETAAAPLLCNEVSEES